VLHLRDEVLALRRPGRIVVVDEAFADAIPGEPASLAGESLPDLVVLRSLTKAWSLAGLRVGYALGPRDVLDRMTGRRPHWPLGTLQLEAIATCSSPEDGCAPFGRAAVRTDWPVLVDAIAETLR
jgi:histidinol-phosphate aminotransferase